MWHTHVVHRGCQLGTPYLVKRRAGWYVRVRTPADLRPAVGEHIVRTLQTSDLATARGRALHVAAGMPFVWHEVRSVMVKILGRDIDDLTHDDLQRGDRDRLLSDFNALGGEDKQRLKARLDTIMAEQTKILALDKQRLAVGRAALDAMEHAKMIGRLEGMREAITAGAGAAAGPREAELDEGSKLPVSKHLPKFFADHGVSKKTKIEYETTYRKMMATVGDLPIGSFTNAQLREFFDGIPATVNARGGRTTAAAGTMTKHATALKSLFGWAADKNLCREGVATKLKATKAAKKEEKIFERQPFTADELTRIFSLPLFTGAKSSHFLNEPGTTLIRDHRFYFPLVALLTGGRLNELAQALIGDIKIYGETPYIFITTDIDEEDAARPTPEAMTKVKHLKTENAKRCIPIHPVLRKLGFMEYIELRRNEKPDDGLLFPDYDYGKLFNQRIFKNAKAKSPTKSFHSLRHCYNDMVRALVHNEILQCRLMGHGIKGAGGGKYGSPLTPAEEQAFAALQPAIPLVHLYSGSRTT